MSFACVVVISSRPSGSSWPALQEQEEPSGPGGFLMVGVMWWGQCIHFISPFISVSVHLFLSDFGTLSLSLVIKIPVVSRGFRNWTVNTFFVLRPAIDLTLVTESRYVC